MPSRNTSTAAFSLVELSIVLVILGLLVGGVLGGRSLVKAAELRAITSEFQQWQVALHAFRERFSQMPGDMGNATSFWPGQTDNGNGDSLIFDEEYLLFWQHLALAGLIPGTYTAKVGRMECTTMSPK